MYADRLEYNRGESDEKRMVESGSDKSCKNNGTDSRFYANDRTGSHGRGLDQGGISICSGGSYFNAYKPRGTSGGGVMSETIIVAVLSLAGTLAGSYLSNKKSQALIAYRLEQLEEKVNKHNNLIERTYKLEEQTAIQDEQIRVANHRIADLEQRI